MDRMRIEDEGPPNPRQAEVDRLRDAAVKQATPRRASGAGITAPGPGQAGTEPAPRPEAH